MPFNPKFAELLGAKLLKHSEKDNSVNEEVDTVEALKDKKMIAIYFSAHWCPPCRGFTPQLAEWYDTSYKSLGMEVVFASSDRDEKSFGEYFAEMPWLALPYSARDLKEKLGEKFECSGIPHLVLLSPDGVVATLDGRSVVSEDPEGAEFPWAKKDLSAVLGDYFEKKGEKKSLAELCNGFQPGSKLGIYFSAHWCPPCRGFTPVLKEAYEKVVTEQKQPFEILFVSSDRSEDQFKEYYGEMPWACLPFGDRDTKKKLSSHFGVQGIPSLVLLDVGNGSAENIKVLNENTVGSVRGDKESGFANFPWSPKLVSDIDQACEGISEKPSLVVIQSSLAKEQQEANTAVLLSLATEQAATVAADAAAREGQPQTCFDAEGAEQFCFFTAQQEGGRLRDRVASECKLDKKAKDDAAEGKPTVMLLCIHKQGGFYEFPAGTAFTKESAAQFMRDYQAGILTRKQMGDDDDDE
jgi:nucleoredoxin